MDIAAWLRDLGLERYAQAFRDNEIDADILPTLTAEDLTDLGVTVVGHRRKLLNAIGALAARNEGARERGATPSPSADARRAEAERRQLTVMFVDLVGSTALSAKLDPEDMGAVIRAYQGCCSEAIGRWGGHVAKYMGDGVLAYFGWPQAHEDEAERAVRAGRAIVEMVAALKTPADDPLAARVGIATGLVMVGELIGEGAAQEQTVVGETPNLAARLQGLAEPGGVVIGPGTERLVAALFELADLGDHELRGFDAPVRAWRVVGPGRAESRFAARSATGLTPFVGREHELGLLLDRFEQAKESEGQVVLLSGEPGIGKSRLAHALIERLAEAPHIRLRYYCSPYHLNSALHPVIEQIERAAGFVADDSAERKLEKLETLLSEGTNDPGAVAPLFAALLSIPMGTRYAPLDLPAQRQRELTIAAMVDQVSGLAARSPVLMVLEDAHWIDPTTTELFERFIERLQTLPVLLLITFRPEFAPPWISYPHMTSLTLNRLGRRNSTEMIAAVAGGKPLPEEVLGQIWAKTEGVALFVEELTKTVLESGLLEDKGDRYELTGPLPSLAIPTTLQDSLMARLDRLTPVKEVAQIGAAIGREFSYRLLAALSPLDEPALQEALSHLVNSELVFRRGTIPDAVYSFKHALVQDAAYASLLRSKHQQLHARIAAVLEERFPETVATQPELLAHHCIEAGLAEKASDYWYQAGQRAIARSAMAEAATQLANGLKALQSLPDGCERQQHELGLQVALGRALIAAKGFAATDTGRAYARARELCQQLGDTAQLFPVLYGQYVFHFERAELDTAQDVARELLRLAQERGDVSAQVTGHRIFGSVTFQLGKLTLARTHLEEGLALYDPVRDRSSGLVYAIDSRVICSTWLSHALFALGFPEQAWARNAEALVYARELAHPASLALALWRACSFHRFSGDADAVRQLAEARIGLAAERGFPQDLAAGEFDRSWALLTTGPLDECIAQMQNAMTAYRATGAQRGAPADLADLADAYGSASRPAKALALSAEALERVERTGERWYEAELHRRRGELLLSLAKSDRGEVETCFHRAIAVAREQNARMWELRAATSLARLWAEQGERQKAHDLLAPVYGWFTEGFDTPDLKDAKTLLDALR